MKEQERRHAIELKLSRMEVFPRRPGAVSTGFAPLNAALDTGGFPRGAIVEIFGPSCGKTTLALQTVARLQETGGEAGWIDADRTFDPSYAAGLGVALDRLPLARPDSAEQALEIACQLAASGALDLLVVDSAAALTPQMEMQAAIGESGPGLHSRVLASGLRKLARAVADGKVPQNYICANQSALDAAARAQGAELERFVPGVKAVLVSNVSARRER